MELLFPVILLVLMWALFIRPQQQRMRQQRALLASLEVGDEVLTVGGIIGRITALDDEVATLEVAPGVAMKVARGAVNRRLGPEPEPPIERPFDGPGEQA